MANTMTREKISFPSISFIISIAVHLLIILFIKVEFKPPDDNLEIDPDLPAIIAYIQPSIHEGGGGSGGEIQAATPAVIVNNPDPVKEKPGDDAKPQKPREIIPQSQTQKINKPEENKNPVNNNILTSNNNPGHKIDSSAPSEPTAVQGNKPSAGTGPGSGESKGPTSGKTMVANAIPPWYPKNAESEGIEGTVSLEVAVIKSDTPTVYAKVKKSSGNKDMDAAALTTIKKRWSFNSHDSSFKFSVDIIFRIGNITIKYIDDFKDLSESEAEQYLRS